jgi:hypothetical protein
MHNRVAYILLLTLLLTIYCPSAALVHSHSQNKYPPDGTPDQPPPVQKFAFQSTGGYTGKVKNVGKNWVEIEAGWIEWVAQDRFGNPLSPNENKNTKSKQLSAEGTILGGIADGPGDKPTYLLNDVRTGDVVSITTATTRKGDEFTLSIIIERRPGGRIPRLSGEVFNESSGELHLRYQAYQDWEEKGTPIPQRFLSAGRCVATSPPYPPVAPQPHEVKY